MLKSEFDVQVSKILEDHELDDSNFDVTGFTKDLAYMLEYEGDFVLEDDDEEEIVELDE